MAGEKSSKTFSDWAAIRMEYITTGASYATLAKKYGLSHNSVNHKGSSEKWPAERKKYMDKKLAELHKKTLKKEVNKESARLTKMDRAADILINKVLKAAEQLDQQVTKRTLRKRVTMIKPDMDEDGNPMTVEKTVTDEELAVKGNLPLDRAGIRQLAGALRDLRDVMVSLQGAAAETDGVQVIVEDYTEPVEVEP